MVLPRSGKRLGGWVYVYTIVIHLYEHIKRKNKKENKGFRV